MSAESNAAEHPTLMSRLGQVGNKVVAVSEIRIIALVVLTIILLTIATPNFATGNNLKAMGAGLAVDAIVAVGMTVVLISGGFDLSVGSVIGLSGMITGLAVLAGAPPALALLVGILVGATVGLVNGLLIAKVGINALITTLGTMTAVASLALVVTSGAPVSMFPKSYLSLGQGRLAGVPYLIITALVVTFVGDFLMRRLRLSRWVYFLGSNEQAARLTGLPVDPLRIGVYILVGCLAGLAGVLTTSRLSAAFPLSGSGTELRVITACVLGGASIYGGEGSIIGSFLGVLLMALIANGLVMLKVSVYWQGFASGVLLILAVTLDIVTRKRRA
jgi:ribose transport system permease protein